MKVSDIIFDKWNIRFDNCLILYIGSSLTCSICGFNSIFYFFFISVIYQNMYPEGTVIILNYVRLDISNSWLNQYQYSYISCFIFPHVFISIFTLSCSLQLPELSSSLALSPPHSYKTLPFPFQLLHSLCRLNLRPPAPVGDTCKAQGPQK